MPLMETITRDVGQMKTQERSAAELLVGHALREHERVIVHVLALDADETASEDPQPTATLPDWCNVYKGMTEKEVDDVQQSITRCNVTRSFE